MIVGQQTHSWFGCLHEDKGADPVVGTIQEHYRKFNLGQGKKGRSPFWQAAHKLAACLGLPTRAFVWGNVFPCDQNKKRPKGAIAETLLKFRVLPKEIEIIKPDAVVFFTGPKYDSALDRLFPNCLSPCAEHDTRLLSRVNLSDHSPIAYRTYHPKHLWMKRKAYVLLTIADLIERSFLSQ